MQTPAPARPSNLLNRQNLFALIFRTNNMKTPAGRAKKIETLVAMLAKGETIVPQRVKKKAAVKRAKKKKKELTRPASCIAATRHP